MRTFIIPFDFCNLGSVKGLLQRSGHQFDNFNSNSSLNEDDLIILPGVGTFEQGMNYLNHHNLTEKLIEHSANNGKILGICLGMQLLLDTSDESPRTKGLGIIHGAVKPLTSIFWEPTPSIGWMGINPNELVPQSTSSRFLIDESIYSRDFFFLHSYFCCPSEHETILATTNDLNKSISFPSIIQVKQTLGVQFHPEKSGDAGLSFFEKFYLL
jgi:glutamine amidotransferase